MATNTPSQRRKPPGATSTKTAPSNETARCDDDIPLITILRTFARYSLWILAIVLPAYIGIRLLVASPATNWIFLPLQRAEAYLVVALSRAVGIEVALENGIEMHYLHPLPDHTFLNLRLGPDCTGIMELVFLVALILSFRHVPLKNRLRWSAVLGSVLFFENILRMVLNYPIAVRLGGVVQWLRFHNIWFTYGQLVVVMALFALWYFFVARHAENAAPWRLFRRPTQKPGRELQSEG